MIFISSDKAADGTSYYLDY